MANRYPVLKDDIFFAKIKIPQGFQVKIRNTTTQEEFKATPVMFLLLELCTGTRTVLEIINQLFGQSATEAMVQNADTMLKDLQKKGIITMKKTPSKGAALKEINLKYPLESAQIEITNKCNLSCLHCFNNSGNPHPEELTTQEIFSLIDRLSSMGVYQVTFTGGEPLLHPHIFDIIEHARKAPMSVDVFTNGTLITEDTVEHFKRLKIRRFNISLDSVDETIHDTFRGKKGALKKTLNAVTLLKEAGFSMKFSISLSQLNKDKVIDILKFLKAHHLKEYTVIPVRYSGRGASGLTVSLKEYYNRLVEQFTYLKEEFPEGISEIHKKERDVCDIARRSIGIKSDGTIMPCPGCDRGPHLGNVRNTDLEKLWEEDETLETIRNTTTRTDKTCKTCKYLDFCVGCIAGAFSVHGALRCCYPHLCELKKAYGAVGLLRRN